VDARWEDAIEWCAIRFGPQDHPTLLPKSFYRRRARKLGLLRAVSNKRIRWLLAAGAPSLRPAEWVPPNWLADLDAMRSALTVIKINQSPAFASWVLRTRPEQRVVHIVRHPAAYLHSWSARFLKGKDAKSVRRDNLGRLRIVAAASPSWGNRFGDLERMSPEESELWFWLYAVETTHTAGANRPSYYRVFDEELAADAVAASRSFYAFCGLEWTPRVEERIGERAAVWARERSRWTNLVSKDQARTVRRVLEGSEVWGWWEPDQVVSGIEYTI
jgi:hypothetical protein